MEPIEEHQTNSFPRAMYTYGIICVILSSLVFLGFDLFYTRSSEDWFFINYIIFALLLLVALISGALKFFGFTKSYNNVLVFPVMVAGTISCFALNREFAIFYQSAPWLTALLIITNCTVLLIPFLEHFPNTIQKIAFVILGICWCIYLYFCIVLIPVYPIGAIGIIFLGFGIHAFIPLICLIALTSFFYNESKQNNKSLRFTYATIAIIVAVILLFIVRWNIRTTAINNVKQEMNLNAPSDLPDWSLLAQKIPADKLSKKILMADVMYTTSELFFERDFGFGMNGMNAEAERIHDPLITLATLFSDKIDLSDDEIIKVMETSFDIRHLTESRLWTGKDLVSKTITSNIRIYPNERLAYTEKIINVANNSKNEWRNQQEAIYSFYLPEGATVSSLSLWINGVEEKGYLTTKGKAQKAYTTIVGVEQRDPSVVHWQEGNRVSVRIFPCTIEEPRQFKIGITSPLKLIGDRLVYDNIYFKGPDASNAKEIVQVNYTDKVNDLEQASFLKKSNGINTYKAKHTYEPNWSLSFKKSAVKENQFVLDHKKYSIQEAKLQTSNQPYDTYYLDVNKNWTSEEWRRITAQLKGKKVLVFMDKLITVNDDNSDDIFESLQQNSYSIFPLYKIPANEAALIITKSNGLSPNLNELKGSNFYYNTTQKIINQKNLAVVDFGDAATPYLKTLNEFRAIFLQQKTIDETIQFIKSNHSLINPETENSVYLPGANLIIKEEETSDTISNNSDHVYRMYAYNTVLKQLNTAYYTTDSITDESIKLAAKANVVTPVSSLIVLEKQEDYDRFDIKKNKDGIGNASMHSDGAVPEPHEWALIIALSLFIIYALKTKKNAIAA